MLHFNGSPVCAVDVRYTGVFTPVSEVLELAISNTDAHFKPCAPYLHIKVIPQYSDYVDVKPVELARYTTFGLSQTLAEDAVYNWYDKTLAPKYRSKGFSRIKITPLFYNAPPAISALKSFLTGYDEIFTDTPRDLYIAAQTINDITGYWGGKVPYSKQTLKWLANQSNVSTENMIDCMQRCFVIAESYQKLMYLLRGGVTM